MASIRYRGRSWTVEMMINGKRRYQGRLASRAEAEEIAAQWRQEIGRPDPEDRRRLKALAQSLMPYLSDLAIAKSAGVPRATVHLWRKDLDRAERAKKVVDLTAERMRRKLMGQADPARSQKGSKD